MKSELIPENGDPPIPITRDITVVGRREYCDVRIDHPTVSKRHCVLVRTSGLLILRDLATTNGTKVKGQRIRWAALLPGDKVSFGGYKARIYLGPDDTPSPSETAGQQVEPLTGFASPTPPVLDAGGLCDEPASGHLPDPESRPSPSPTPAPVSASSSVPDEPDEDEVIDLSEDDVVAEDDGAWERLQMPSGGDQFFIELD